MWSPYNCNRFWNRIALYWTNEFWNNESLFMSHLNESSLISFVYNHFTWRFFRSHRWFWNLFRLSRRRCRTSRWCCHRCVNWCHICGSIVIYTLTYSTFSSFLSISFLFCFPGDHLSLLPLINLGSKWTVQMNESGRQQTVLNPTGPPFVWLSWTIANRRPSKSGRSMTKVKSLMDKKRTVKRC